MSFGRFYCKGCVTFFTRGEERVSMCERCAADYVSVRRVHTKVCGRHQKTLGTLSPSKLLWTLYEKAKAKANLKKGSES
jgi:hypothetical protein